MVKGLAPVAAAILVMSCDQKSELVFPREPIISLSVHNLPPLAEGEGHYQVWATFFVFEGGTGSDGPRDEEEFVSLGEFQVSTQGRVVHPHGGPVQFRIPQGWNAQLLDEVIVTLQPEGEGELHEEPGPVLMGGRFTGSAAEAIAELDVRFGDALRSDFADVGGRFTLTAPTSVPADSNSGIWFINFGPTITPGLSNLPVLPSSWTYEGWVVDRGNPLAWQYHTTGKFRRADTSDFDGAGPGQGPGTGLNFPGQDFIVGALSRPDLRQEQYLVLVTVEPEPDNSPDPFFLVILSSHEVLPVQGGDRHAANFYNVARGIIPRGQIRVLR